MSLLFDIPPEETPKKRARARMEAPPPALVQDAEKTPYYMGQTAAAVIHPIGTIDHTYECADVRCQGTAHDILHEEMGEWLLGCCFCNSTQWVPVIRGHLEPKPAEFQFRDGRFAGLTIDEAASQPRGMDYVAWAAREHKRQAVKTACETWLARNQTG